MGRNRSQPFYFNMKLGPPKSANQKPPGNMLFWSSKINESHFTLLFFGPPNSTSKMALGIGLSQKYIMAKIGISNTTVIIYDAAYM